MRLSDWPYTASADDEIHNSAKLLDVVSCNNLATDYNNAGSATVLTNRSNRSRIEKKNQLKRSVAQALKCIMEESESEENALVSHQRSLHAIIETPVRFVNRTGRQVNIKWINYSGEEVLEATIMSNNWQDFNTFMTHPWIAVDSETNERMLLNFSETYLPGEPEVRRMDYQHRRAYVVRAQVIITLPGKRFLISPSLFSSKLGFLINLWVLPWFIYGFTRDFLFFSYFLFLPVR